MKQTFFDAYVECALWSSNDESAPSGGEPLDRNYSASDIADETLQKMKTDCEQFQAQNDALLTQYYDELPVSEWGSEAQAGHDFWLSRNGHGAGFFDRDVSKYLRDTLQDNARAFGTFDLYIGDDGQIYGQ
jgi:hypothetical protein